LLEHGLAVGHAFFIHQTGEVVPDGGAELGLVIEEVQHLQVGLQAGGEVLVAGTGYTPGQSAGFELGHAGGEAGGVGGVGGVGGRGEEQGQGHPL